MILARNGLLPAIAAALLLLFNASTTQGAEGDRIEARFEIFGFAGIHVLTERTTVEEAADRYSIVTDLDTRGLASIFVDLTSHSKVNGRVSGDGLSPFDYRADMRRNGTDRRYGVDYRSDGTVIDVSSPPAVVPAQKIRGTVDQLTAYFMVQRQLAQHGTCALTVPVFDGSGLYDLRFTDIKQQTLSADGYQNFTGMSQSCEVVRKDIVKSPDRLDDTYQRGRIWYARVMAGDRMEPVRMEFDTSFGVVKGYLTELRGNGVDLHLTGE
jgi:hypothetical protein